MFTNRVRQAIAATLQGLPLSATVEEFTPPKLTLKTEEFRAAGMDAPIELTMGLEKLEASFSLIAVDRAVLAAFDVAEGKVVPFVAREALESFDGTVTPVIHTLRGKVKEIDHGTLKPGDKVGIKISMAVTYYKLQHGRDVITEIDVENMVRVIDGKDTAAPVRAALGM